jgi:hypothetical protein
MAVGRITGPLLASNLLRDGVNISVETDLLYLDVQTGRIGIKTSAPQYALDVNGTANVGVLRVSNTSTLGLLTVTKSLTSGTIGSTLGPIHIDPAGNNKIWLDADTEVVGSLHASGNITADGNIRLGDTTATDTLQVGAEFISNLIPQIPNTYNIGSAGQNWNQGYFKDLFAGNMRMSGNTLTNVLPGSIDIVPNDGVINLKGNVKIWGGTPLGTGPVTANTLYVNEDGSDTNDGGAIDASRACRTVSGATKSPLYKPGTSIKVAPGRYLENNPIEMKPYTSVIGSDLRTTIIEPINKTQDLFHVRQGCYIAQLMMYNGRSGRFPGTGYTSNTNRGAYATAYPPQGDNGKPIDVFHSPYIQNCTNQSGPWLYDGTMFVPNQTIQVPEGVGISTYEAGSQEITVTLTEGQLYTGQSINGGPPNPGFFNARTLLLANKAFIQEQTVAYVDETYGGPFQYDAVKCARDTGLIIDGLGLDLIYNSTSQSVFSGLQYWNQTSTPTQITGEVTTTTNAINYVNSIAQLVVRGQSLSNPYQNTLTQITALPVGSIGNANTISTLFTTVTNIIVQGTAGITDKIIPNGTAVTTDASTLNAAALLQANKEFLKAEAIAWITSNAPTFVYSKAKCKRDVGYIIDSVTFDLLRGGNRQVIQAGTYYYGYSTTQSAVPNEQPQTILAYDYMKSVISAVVQSQRLTSFYQSEIPQVLDNVNAGTATAAGTLANDIDVITRLIRVGPSGAPELLPIGLTITNEPGLLNAYNLLVANKNFIKAEVIAYVNSLPNFVYNKELCYRDTGIILENVSFDALAGGNEKTVEAGLAYYNGVTSVISGQETQTTGAINYIKSLADKIIKNQTAPNLLGTRSINSQVINYALTGGGIASTVLADRFDIITNIITNGPDAAPTSYPACAVDPYFMAAEILLETNRAFIQEEIVAYVNQSFLSFPYNSAKCRRDTALIVDAIAFDLLYPTADKSQSTFSGLQYFNQNGYTGLIGTELTTTTNAITYLSSIAQKIILNDVSGPRYQSVSTQSTTGAAGTVLESSSVGTNFDLIVDIILNGTDTVTDKIVPNGEVLTTPGVVHAYAQLQANKSYLQDEIIAYVESTKTAGFVYDQALCRRDTGYIIDSISFDLLHGGNRQAIQSAVYYYSFNANSSAIPNEKPQTIAAYNHLKGLIHSIVTATPIARSRGNLLTQVTNLPPASTAESEDLEGLVDVITNIINNGPSVVTNKRPISLTMSTSKSVQRAFALMIANRAFLANEIVSYIDETYNSSNFSYNKAKCFRDTGLIVDSLIGDLGWGANGFVNSSFAGLQYWNQNGYTGSVGSELTTTTNAIGYLSSIAQKVVRNDVSGVRYQSTVTQVFNTLPPASAIESLKIAREFTTVTNILIGGTTGVSDLVIPNGITVFSANAQKAFDLLQANKNYLQAEVIAFVDATKTAGFAYDTVKWKEDFSYLLDAVSHDVLYDGNRQAITAAVYYYDFNPNSTMVPNEQNQTVGAYDRLKQVVTAIITEQAIIPSPGNIEPQQFNNNPSSVEVGTVLLNMLSLITNIINNGPAEAIAKAHISLQENETPLVQKAIILLNLNRTFIQNEIIAWTDSTYGTDSFNYNQEKCYRDVGLIVDSIAQDLLIGGNRKTIEAGISYWTGGVNVIANEIPQNNAAMDYLKTVCEKVVTNTTFTTISGANQIVNTFFAGGVYALGNITRLIDILKNIIAKGPDLAPEGYEGSGVFNLIGTSADFVQSASTILDVQSLGGSQYKIYLSEPVLGPSSNGTLYFGQTSVYPAKEKYIPARWAQRRVDPLGSIGGSLVDGGVVSNRSPIQSMVYDAFTQVNQGGIGIKITNNGYAQLVSVFTIFCGTSVIVENGGICSITNSNANFGDFCLVAKGYGKREFFGEVYNPPVLPYYPNGFFPQQQQVEVFCPDPDDRPHIGLIMEVVPPESYTNAQGLSGFLQSAVNTSTLTTGSVTINGIDTEGIVIGQKIYARDQYGSYTDINGTRYIPEDAIVTDVNFKSITLSDSISAGGGDPANVNYFTMYIAGNAYYTVRSSELAPDPIAPGTFKLGASATIQGNDQGAEEIQALQYINTITNNIVSNILVDALQTTATQVTNIALSKGGQSTIKIGQLFQTLENIISNGLTAVPAISREGIVSPGANDAAALLTSNKSFIQAEIIEYINSQYFVYDHATCRRDLGYILDSFAWDALFQSNYQSIKSGNAYLRNVPGSKYVLETEKVQTTDAITKLAAITNQLAGISTVTQAISIINVDGININNIINGNTAPAYNMPNPAGFDSGIANGKSLILNNLDFIKEETIGWINATYPIFTYSETKCKRDIGLIIDSVEWDIVLGTNYRSIKAGQSYYRVNAGNVINGEKTQTLATINFVKGVILDLQAVQNSSTATQTVTNDFTNIASIIQTGISASPTVTYTIPPGTATGVSSASQLLQGNKSYIQAEVDAYIHVTYPSFVYDRNNWKISVGFLLDALIYDLTYGGNSMSVDAALQYFNSANNNVRVNPGEVPQTVASINYINTIAARVVQNLAPVVSYQNGILRFTNLGLGQGSVAVQAISDLVSDMATIVQDGVNAVPIITEPSYAWSTASQRTARTAIQSAKVLIATEAITFINENFTSFTYNQATCKRDLDYIIHSLIYDLTYSGNWQTVDAGTLYFDATGKTLIPGTVPQTVGSFNYLLTLMKYVSTNTAPAVSYQNTYTQFTNGSATNGQNAHPRLTALTGILTDIVANGPSVAPAIEYPSTSGYSSVLQGVKAIIEAQKTSLVNQVIAYIDTKYNGFEYDQALCKRDTGYIIDALAADLISGGNYNITLCGKSYYAIAETHHYVTLEDNVADAALFPNKANINFYRRAYMSASGYLFEYVGAGSDYGSLPQIGRRDPRQDREVIQLNNGKVFFTSTDQNGDFRIGPGLVISQATGVLSGRTFTKSLFANLTPFILAIEG